MSLEKDDNAYLWDMLTAAHAIETFVKDRTPADYLADLMLRSAVERQVEIIGEAAVHISAAFQAAHPEIPWRPMQAHAPRFCPRLWRDPARSASGTWPRSTFRRLIQHLEPLLPPPPE